MSNPSNERRVGGLPALVCADVSRLVRTSLLWWTCALMAAIPASMQVMTGPMSAFDPWGSVSSIASAAIFVGMGVVMAVFVADDWRSGYVKNLFAVSPKHGSYVASKVITGGVIGAILTAGYVLGAAATGILLHATYTTGFFSLVAAVISKLALAVFFGGLFISVQVPCKGRAWLSVSSTLVAAMLFAPVILVTSMMPLPMACGLSLVAAPLGLAGFTALTSFVMGKHDLI